MPEECSFAAPSVVVGMSVCPVMVILDDFGNNRSAELTPWSFGEMQGELVDAHLKCVHSFVIVSHCFELLRRGASEPNWIAVKRFTQLCKSLCANREEFARGGFGGKLQLTNPTEHNATRPQASTF